MVYCEREEGRNGRGITKTRIPLVFYEPTWRYDFVDPEIYIGMCLVTIGHVSSVCLKIFNSAPAVLTVSASCNVVATTHLKSAVRLAVAPALVLIPANIVLLWLRDEVTYVFYFRSYSRNPFCPDGWI